MKLRRTYRQVESVEYFLSSILRVSAMELAGKLRQVNKMVQELVADAITNAVTLFARHLHDSKYPYRLKLAIHDDILLACAGEAVPYLVEEVIPNCMSKWNVVPGLNFSFGVETSRYLRWTEKSSDEEFENAGWPKGYKIAG